MSKASFINELSIPAIAAPMFLISGPKLVIECCKNGIVGTFPALNQRTTEGFEAWILEIKSALATYEKETGKKPAPFGVNLIVHKSNPRLEADLAICVKHKIALIITSLGAVSELVNTVHSYGGLVFHDIIKKPLIENSPNFIQSRMKELKSLNWKEYFMKNWITVSLSVVIGAYSHIFWDSFTHSHSFFEITCSLPFCNFFQIPQMLFRIENLINFNTFLIVQKVQY